MEDGSNMESAKKLMAKLKNDMDSGTFNKSDYENI